MSSRWPTRRAGSGKTTTAINLAASLAAAERRVLAVDADPQGNLTSASGARPASRGRASTRRSIDQRPLEQILVSTDLRAPDPRPRPTATSPGRRWSWCRSWRREYRLKEALAPVADRYDYVVRGLPAEPGPAHRQRAGRRRHAC